MTLLNQFIDLINNLKKDPRNDIKFIINCAVTYAVLDNIDDILSVSDNISFHICNTIENNMIQEDINILTNKIDKFEMEINDFYEFVENDKNLNTKKHNFGFL